MDPTLPSLLSPKKRLPDLPDDIAKRLIRFINGGNTYDAYIKAAEKNRITVFIREKKRTAKFKNQPTFPMLSPVKTRQVFSGSRSSDETED